MQGYANLKSIYGLGSITITFFVRYNDKSRTVNLSQMANNSIRINDIYQQIAFIRTFKDWFIFAK